jgi:hypothetical protein
LSQSQTFQQIVSSKNGKDKEQDKESFRQKKFYSYKTSNLLPLFIQISLTAEKGPAPDIQRLISAM